MRVVLADLTGTGGLVSKDTVAGGYGSRLTPFSKVTAVYCALKRRLHSTPSVQMAYLASLAAARGHEVVFTTDAIVAGDVGIVLSSLVDYRRECAWADEMRRTGTPVGAVGLAATKMPELFADHTDFIIAGEPEEAFIRLLDGALLRGLSPSTALSDLDALPFPRWDLIRPASPWANWRTIRPVGGGFPLLASRGCPEFCTYCPHRIMATHRVRSIENIVEELAQLTSVYPNPYVIFRDPLFSDDRERCLALCDAIRSRGLTLRFECETRLDRLDHGVLTTMQQAGLRAMSFGVESLSPETLRKAGRRPIPQPHQRAMLARCRELGIVTAGFYVFGFLQDTWESIAATIDYSIRLGSSFAQYKILTPYPGTPLWKQMQALVTEADWQRFDGFTPTFTHPHLTHEDMRFLLGAAYARFYMRPTFLGDQLGLTSGAARRWLSRLDVPVVEHHRRRELVLASRAVSC